MKPSKHDKKVNILITGQELEELQRHIGSMCESSGSDLLSSDDLYSLPGNDHINFN